jgi:hypothetical protein
MLRGMITLAAAAISMMNATTRIQNITQASPTSQPVTRVVFNAENGYEKI